MLELKFLKQEDAEASLEGSLLAPDGSKAAEFQMKSKKAKCSVKVPVADVKLWSAEKPNLYTLELALKKRTAK